jgi:hypothetical protein
MDFGALKGRLLSSSYIPQSGEADYESMLNDLKNLFGKYQEAGRVRLGYDTKMYFTQF